MYLSHLGYARSSYFQAIDGGAPVSPLEAASHECASILLMLKEANIAFDVHAVDMTEAPTWLSELADDVTLPIIRLPGNTEWLSSKNRLMKELKQRYRGIRRLNDRRRITANRHQQEEHNIIWQFWSLVREALGLDGRPPLLLSTADSNALREELLTKLGMCEILFKIETPSADSMYLNGTRPGVTDCDVAPILELVINLCHCSVFKALNVNIELEAPMLLEYMAR